MDFEVPIDSWYVWCGVVLVGMGLLGFALAIPTQPPPDAERTANTIDDVAGSSYQAHGRYEHRATEVRLGTKQISLRNDAGTDHASISYGSITPVSAIENEDNRSAFRRLLHGESVNSVLLDVPEMNDERTLREIANTAMYSIEQTGATWQPSDGVVYVRKLVLDDEPVVLVDA